MILLQGMDAHAANSPLEMEKYAFISACKKFRYVLSRSWTGGKRCLFVMLNPSTADAENDDPTIRKCIGFAKRWGFGALDVLNVYAFRTTYPSILQAEGYPTGDANGLYLEYYAAEASRIVCAWGRHARTNDAGAAEQSLRTGMNRCKYPLERLTCLGRNKDESPRHPLMLAYDTQLETY